MDGVSLFHDTVKNATKVIDLPGVPLKRPYLCPTCNVTHRVKSIHLNFDGNGVTVVARKVVELIRAGAPGGWPSDIAVGATLANPPKTKIDLNTGSVPSLRIERAPINHKIVVHNVGI